MILLSLLLAAAPPVMLEPDAGSANRLHPRRVTSSSFLENGWNKHEQNYLPLYVADDDPTTAWVEGAKGRGEGEALEWWGPELTRAKTYRLFIRNGFQKSEKLFRANARPRKVKLEPLVQGETGAQVTGTALETELKDVLGWQEVRLPVPNKVHGVRLTLASTYPGTTYDDTCISDLRVYVEGEDPYKPEAEAAAFEQVRAFALERKQSAARSGNESKMEWAPRYTVETLLSRDISDDEEERGLTYAVRHIATVPEMPGYKSALERAKKAAELFDRASLDYQGQESEARAKWTRVKPMQLRSQTASARTALSAMESDGIVRIAGMLHQGDVSFFEADASQAKMKAALKKASKAQAQQAKSCISTCEKRRKAEGKNEDAYDCDCEGECLGCGDPALPVDELLKHQLTGGDFLQGSLAKPTAFLRGKSELSGSRESWYAFRQTLVTYVGEKADVVITNDHQDIMMEGTVSLRIHVIDWGEKNGKASPRAITSFLVSDQRVLVLRYSPASKA